MLKIRLGLCTALSLGLLAGCFNSRSPQAEGRISGQVKYKGTPVPGGSILFHTDGKGVYGSPIQADGTYEVRDLPTGTLVVTVETESANPAKKAPEYGGDKGAKMYAERMKAEGRVAAEKSKVGEYRKIPEKYANPKRSPLTVEIVAGRQVKDFDLD
jgi:hypothetical protein